MNKKTLRFLFCMMASVCLVACQEQRPVATQDEAVLVEMDDEAEDFLLEESEVDYEAMTDGLFDDFVYRFMQDSLFQSARIHFPLVYRVDGESKRLVAEQWTYDSIFSVANDYTTVYDGRDTLERTCDAQVKQATIEVVDLKQERVKLYHFERNGKHWLLDEIDEHFFDHDNNHGFFSFYSRFSSDDDYQLSHVQDPFYFKTYDADSFQEIEGWVSAEQWPDYRTYLPGDKLFNTIYDGARPTTAYRRLVIGSPSSGMSCSLLFKRIKGKWMLVSMEN